MSLALSITLLIVIELSFALFSHPECGTAAMDYMPCSYLPRLGWHLESGSWLVPSMFLAAFNIGYAVNIISKKKTKQSR
jgi:hypothetical protein